MNTERRKSGSSLPTPSQKIPHMKMASHAVPRLPTSESHARIPASVVRLGKAWEAAWEGVGSAWEGVGGTAWEVNMKIQKKAPNHRGASRRRRCWLLAFALGPLVAVGVVRCVGSWSDSADLFKVSSVGAHLGYPCVSCDVVQLWGRSSAPSFELPKRGPWQTEREELRAAAVMGAGAGASEAAAGYLQEGQEAGSGRCAVAFGSGAEGG